MHLKQNQLANDALAVSLDSAHAVAYHKGLGSSFFPSQSTVLGPYLNENTVAAFAKSVYAKPNIAIVADGATQDSLSKWIDPFFRDVPASPEQKLPLFTEASKYYGGEQRTSLSGSNAFVIAFPGSSLSAGKADLAVLTSLLGGESSIKWSPGFSLFAKASADSGANVSAKHLAYSDSGLLTIQITGSAHAVRKGAAEAVKALKSVAESGVTKDVLTKAIAKAKFDLLSANELTGAGLVSAGNSLIHGSKIFQVTDALKSYEAVTADQVKAVRLSIRRLVYFDVTSTNMCSTGCKDVVGRQGDGGGNRRSLRSAIRGGDWSSGIEGIDGRLIGERARKILYQQFGAVVEGAMRYCEHSPFLDSHKHHQNSLCSGLVLKDDKYVQSILDVYACSLAHLIPCQHFLLLLHRAFVSLMMVVILGPGRKRCLNHSLGKLEDQASQMKLQ